jgi:hypothetical protein
MTTAANNIANNDTDADADAGTATALRPLTGWLNAFIKPSPSSSSSQSSSSSSSSSAAAAVAPRRFFAEVTATTLHLFVDVTALSAAARQPLVSLSLRGCAARSMASVVRSRQLHNGIGGAYGGGGGGGGSVKQKLLRFITCGAKGNRNRKRRARAALGNGDDDGVDDGIFIDAVSHDRGFELCRWLL